MKRLLGLTVLLLLAVNVATFYFNYQAHEKRLMQLAQDRITQDAKSYLPHLFSTGNKPLLTKSILQYKEYGIHCFELYDERSGYRFGFGENCQINAVASNVFDQEIYRYSYSLPKIQITRFLKDQQLSIGLNLTLEIALFVIAFSLIQRTRNQKIKLLQQKESAALARRVAHDIRSPLAALSTAIDCLDDSDNELYNLLRVSTKRITSIANDLSTRADEDRSESLKTENLNVHNLVYLAYLVTREKQLIHDQREKLKIEFFYSDYDACSRVNRTAFLRSVSNIIDNAIQAHKAGFFTSIRVSVISEKDTVSIVIVDNGNGVAQKHLTRVFDEGFTTRKSGSGIGLSTAKEYINGWGGELFLKSQEGEGTEVTLSLPRVKNPGHFITRVDLSSYGKIFIIDDQESILETWMAKMPDALKERVEFFSSIDEELVERIRNCRNCILLIDENLGSNHFGSELIIKNGLAAKSILVTSESDSPRLIEKCRQHQIRVIDKIEISIIPIV